MIKAVPTEIPEKEEQQDLMREALALAKEAAEDGEVPVGAVVVCEGKIVGRGRNRREGQKNCLCHAEMEAISEACQNLGGWRLHRCDLYVTLEPCPMCAGAAQSARIRRVVYGAKDEKTGAFGTVLNLNEAPLPHHPVVEEGLLEEDCQSLLTSFFLSLREKRRALRSKEKDES